MLVRSWNLFHGNTLPPDRRSHLEQMIRLAAADRPDALCLQEVPLWALSRLSAWSGMGVQHVVTRRALLGTWLGGVITRLNNGLFRSGLAGQANAILLAPGLDVLAQHKLRIDQHREEPRFCHAVRLEGLVIGNLHATGALSQPEIAAAEILRAEAFVTGIAGALPACSPATSTCGRTTCRSFRVGRRSAPGSTTCSCGGFPPRRSPCGRSSDGVTTARCCRITLRWR